MASFQFAGSFHEYSTKARRVHAMPAFPGFYDRCSSLRTDDWDTGKATSGFLRRDNKCHTIPKGKLECKRNSLVILSIRAVLKR